MKTNQLPEGANLRQLKIQAKELQTERNIPLSTAQFELAKSYGFASWTKLKLHVEFPMLIESFKSAIDQGAPKTVEKLLSKHQSIREKINDPIMPFDSPPIVWASTTKAASDLLPLLVEFGAEVDRRSSWWAGGFSALDLADEKTAAILESLGAKWDVWSAAKHNRISELTQILKEDPSRVNARGGDGQTPLHFAGSAEVVELLISKGADLEIRDIDHESTPIQNQLQKSEIVKVLLEAGATPDIFTAIEQDNPELLNSILASEPKAIDFKVGDKPFRTEKSNGGHVYAYSIGNSVTPTQYAMARNKHRCVAILKSKISIGNQVLLAAQSGNRDEAIRIAKDHPEFWNDLGRNHSALAFAAQHGHSTAVEILLELGFDPKAPGMDGGTALHLACWFGYSDIVKMLVNRVPLDALDPVHGSPPLGWATHGSHFCRNPKGDYLECVRILVLAGADPRASANKNGVSMLTQAGNREDVKKLLRELSKERS